MNDEQSNAWDAQLEWAKQQSQRPAYADRKKTKMNDDPYKSFDHHIKAQEAEITHLRARIAELEAALDQLLDDMRDGLCVCQQAKDDARAALGGKNG